MKDIFEVKTLAFKDFFATQEDPARDFGFVCSGCLRMYSLTPDGKDLTKHFFLPENFMVGAIQPEEPNPFSIQALTDCRLLVTRYEKMERLSEKNRVVLEFKMNLISEFVQMKQQRENNYLSMDAQARYKVFLKKYPSLIDQIPHYHIASHLGVSPTQLSRIRKKLKCH